jgi:acetyl-CoA carboxylase alpha subunit
MRKLCIIFTAEKICLVYRAVGQLFGPGVQVVVGAGRGGGEIPLYFEDKICMKT